MADIHEVKTSCEMSVPFFSYTVERDALHKWADAMGEQGLEAYHYKKNRISMDGIVTPIGQKWKD
ncbi:hypothetical protein [Brevibacillus massiliensis]|uniref:hypothetical protein n=2 Tax=Brevibacillus massiliensis TaxID=1118054 RepID=UPI0011CC1CAA|nr:hypothetical protein [Brevibacillus massiliensis]